MAKSNKAHRRERTVARSGHTAATRLRRLLAARRREAQVYAVRGAAYGAGSGAVGLMFWWLRHRL
jgi:hypothetical protein